GRGHRSLLPGRGHRPHYARVPGPVSFRPRRVIAPPARPDDPPMGQTSAGRLQLKNHPPGNPADRPGRPSRSLRPAAAPKTPPRPESEAPAAPNEPIRHAGQSGRPHPAATTDPSAQGEPSSFYGSAATKRTQARPSDAHNE